MADLITLTEARGAFDRAQIRQRIRSGQWRRVFRGVYLSGEEPADRRTVVRAALLSAGPGLVAVRESAAVLHGFDVVPSPLAHLAGRPDTSRPAPPGIRIHAATLAPGDTTVVEGVPCTTAARTAVDLARVLRRIDAIAVVDAALRRGACTPDELAVAAAGQPGLRGIVQAREILALADAGAESPMESRLRLRIVDAGLPRPTTQVPVLGGRYRLDLGWEEQRVGAEYDGAVHLDRLTQRSDLARRNRLAQAGWTVYSFTDTDVYLNHVALVGVLRRHFELIMRKSPP